tara:strand:- start:1948 stop:2286 length:339 start_codon:yes stop_codon:yes gene_type:complete
MSVKLTDSIKMIDDLVTKEVELEKALMWSPESIDDIQNAWLNIKNNLTPRLETLYAIHYVYDGEHTFEGITNNFDAWLKDHNEFRAGDGNSIEDADDFDVEEVQITYFKKGE